MFNNIMNYPLIITLLILYMVDVKTKLQGKCTTSVGIFLGTAIGVVFSSVWFMILKLNKLEKVLYYDEYSSNKVACTRPDKQKFKCSVYKNGELLKSI